MMSTTRKVLAIVGICSTMAGSTASLVHASPVDDHPQASTLNVSPSPLLLGKGDAKQADAVVTMADGTKKDVTDDAKTKWTSDNPKTATVDAKGKIVGVGMGITKVKASFGGSTSSIEVTVGP